MGRQGLVAAAVSAACVSAYTKEWHQTQYTTDSGMWGELGMEGGAVHGLGASDVDGSQLNTDGEAYLDYNTLLWIPECVSTGTCSKPQLPLLLVSQESFHTSEQTVLHFLGGGVAKPDGTPFAGTPTNPTRDNVKEWVDTHEFIIAAPNARSGYFAAEQGTAQFIWQSLLPLRYWAAAPGCCGCTKAGHCADEETEWFEPGSAAEANYEMEETFFRDLVASLDTKYGVDKARVYFMGGGGGGFMPERAACSMADIFAGTYINTGSGHPTAMHCVPSEPVHILQNQYTGHSGVVPEGTSYGGYPMSSTSGGSFPEVAALEGHDSGGQSCFLEWCVDNTMNPPGWHEDPKDPSTPSTASGSNKFGQDVVGMTQTCVDQFVSISYPSSEALAARWAAWNGCDPFVVPAWDGVSPGDGTDQLDLVANDNYNDSQWDFEQTLGAPWSFFSTFAGGSGANVPFYPGDDTEVWYADNCAVGGSVEFQWVMGSNNEGTGFNYVPWNWDVHSAYFLNWVEAHPKTISCSVTADCPTGYECVDEAVSRRALKFGHMGSDSHCEATFAF